MPNSKLDPKMNDLTYRVIGAAMEVHRTLGPGLLENIYESALCVEFDERHIAYACQMPINVQYKGHELGDMRVDILVEDCLIVELKAVEKLMPIHMAQTMTYLKLAQVQLGLLINFNVTILKDGIQRIIL